VERNPSRSLAFLQLRLNTDDPLFYWRERPPNWECPCVDCHDDAKLPWQGWGLIGRNNERNKRLISLSARGRTKRWNGSLSQVVLSRVCNGTDDIVIQHNQRAAKRIIILHKSVTQNPKTKKSILETVQPIDPTMFPSRGRND
jgi:hypothetical protein